MCGIVGAVAERPVEKILIEGLKRLEYRGYDSAGVTIIDKQKQLSRLRVLGKVGELEKALTELTMAPLMHGNVGIAHTRWATHGVPSERNAHPFISHDDIALVHNGIIENHEELRAELLKLGYEFTSDTDSEVIVHYIHYHYQKTNDLLKAVQEAVKKLEGAYALAIVAAHCPHRLIAVRHGSPLVIGKGIGENFVASDVLALLPVAQEFIYLEDRDIIDITRDRIQIYDSNGKLVERSINFVDGHYDMVDRGEYRHYMRKEIAEQAEALATCMEGRVVSGRLSESAFGLELHKKLSEVQAVQLVACGTSYHAALVGKYWIESLAGVPVSVEIASEFRYRNPVVMPKTLFVTLSQSGETADTLAALRLAKNMNYFDTLAICNVPASTLTRESGHTFLMRAGMEIGVASTKAFTTQLLALLLFTLALAKKRNLSVSQEASILSALQELPALVNQILTCDAQITQIAQRFIDKDHALFLARGLLYPIALEGALKLKEISYIHAEGYPAGELKHGPLALVDKNMPVIIVAPRDELFDKVKSNLAEVQARGAEIYVVTDAPEQFDAEQVHIISMPSTHLALSPIAYTLPLQLLAYHVAVMKGTDVDQPRNLAKSVTVE
jgi:glutamine---fructose-6-phosphate transaminase (isomerizing)